MTEAAPSTPAATPVPVAAPVASVETFSAAYVKELRDEAAKYRTEKNDAVEAAKAALTTDFEAKLTEAGSSYAELGTTLSARELELAKLKTLVTLGIPVDRFEDALENLDGATVETLPSRVESMKKIMGSPAPTRVPAVDPSQGGAGTPVIPLNGHPIMNRIQEVLGF